MTAKGPERSLRVLLVDDEGIVHQTLAGYLRDSGHQVDDAYEAESALTLLEQNDYDLALLDVQMPGAIQLYQERYFELAGSSLDGLFQHEHSDRKNH